MKFKLYSIFFLSIIAVTALTTSCKKKKKFTISGILYDTCGVPVKKAKLDIRQRSTRFVDNSGGSLDVIKTDENGAFEFTYKVLDNMNTPISIFDGTAAEATVLMKGIPANTDQVLYLYRKKGVKVGFTIDFATTGDIYTAFDTLWLGDKIKIIGPFKHGQSVEAVSQKPIFDIHGSDTLTYKLCWGIGFHDYYNSTLTLNKYVEYHVIPYKMADCGSNTTVAIKLN